MEPKQKEHIIRNCTRLAKCTKNETVWYDHLLENKFVTPNTFKEISSSPNTTHSRIRKTYLECLKTPGFELLIQTLKKSKNEIAVNILEEFFPTSLPASKSINKSIWFSIQSLTKHYKGREEELQSIQNCWLESCTDNTLAIVAITGLGGIGKSELARKYAYKFYTQMHGQCIWINAENEGTFTDSLYRLAKIYGILLQDSFGKVKLLEALIMDVLKFLSMENCLIVLDNLEDYEKEFLKCFLDSATKIPLVQSKPLVILTSRYQLVSKDFGFMVKQIQLSILPVNAAVSFFKDALKLTDGELEIFSDLESLSQELGHFPLAMQQAAAYINEVQQRSDVITEIKEYLKVFKVQSKALLEYAVPKYQNRDSFSKPIYLTWQITLDKFKSDPKFCSVVSLALNIISYFPSDNISVTLLKSIMRLAVSESTDSGLTFYELGPDAFETLHNYSICQIDKFENVECLSVHRLVQTVSQVKLKEEQKWGATLNMLIRIINEMFQDTVTSNDIHHIDSLLKHTEGCTSILEKPQELFNLLEKVQHKYITIGLYQQSKMFSEFAIRQIKHLYGDEASETLSIMYNYGKSLVLSGALTEAELLLNGVYRNQSKNFNQQSCSNYVHEDHDMLYTKALMAAILQQKGNHDEALKMYLEVLEVWERVLGINHTSTLSVKCSVAEIHQSKGNLEESIQIYLKVLETEEQVLSTDDPAILFTKNNIAEIHRRKSNYDEALKLYFEVLEVRERVLGSKHPDTLNTKHNIAATYQDKGNLDEAHKLYSEVLVVRERVLGIEHPTTLITKNNIAATYHSKGNYDEALKKLFEVLDIREQILGIDHPDTLTTKNNIAATYASKGNSDEALKIYLEVLDVEERHLGIEHPDTLITKNNIAVAHHIKGKFDEAFKMYLEVFEVWKRVLGDDHPETLTTKSNIAVTYESTGKYDEALEICLEVLQVRERVLGLEHPHTLITKNNIAEIHRKKGNYGEALKIALEVLEVKERVLGVDHHSTLATKNNIAVTHERNGNFDEALKIQLEVLKDWERILGNDHPDTLTAKNNIAETHRRKGNYDEALKMYLEVLEARERKLGTEHPSTIVTKSLIAATYVSKENYDLALKTFYEVLEIEERVLGSDHPTILNTKENIAVTHEYKGKYDEALKMYLQILETNERVLGIDHPNTLTTKSIIDRTIKEKILQSFSF